MNTYTTKKAIRTAYNHILDASETLDHLDSVISVKVRPIRNAINEYREARRIAAIHHEVF